MVMANTMYMFSEWEMSSSTTPYGFPSWEICIYYSLKLAYGEKLAVISAYPFSRSNHKFLKSRRLGYC